MISSRVFPVCFARIALVISLVFKMDSEMFAMEVAEPETPSVTRGSWIIVLEWGRMKRCPFFPLARMMAAMLAAMPVQYMLTGTDID